MKWSSVVNVEVVFVTFFHLIVEKYFIRSDLNEYTELRMIWREVPYFHVAIEEEQNCSARLADMATEVTQRRKTEGGGVTKQRQRRGKLTSSLSR